MIGAVTGLAPAPESAFSGGGRWPWNPFGAPGRGPALGADEEDMEERDVTRAENERRAGSASGSISLGVLTLNFDRFQTTVGGERVELTYDEFELLALLSAQPDRVVAYETLARHLWDTTGRMANRRLNVIVHRIRTKLGDIRPYEIRTVRERGYGLLKTDEARKGE
jgi:hypothetical protein